MRAGRDAPKRAIISADLTISKRVIGAQPYPAFQSGLDDLLSSRKE